MKKIILSLILAFAYPVHAQEQEITLKFEPTTENLVMTALGTTAVAAFACWAVSDFKKFQKRWRGANKPSSFPAHFFFSITCGMSAFLWYKVYHRLNPEKNPKNATQVRVTI